MYCAENINFFLNKFSKFILVILIFVSFDVLIQFFVGVDLFGNELKANHGVRLSGPFGDEYIVGSYIGKFVLISVFYFHKDNKFYSIIYLLFIISIVFLSNERSASIMCFAGVAAYLILTPHFNFKAKLINLSTLIIIITILFNINTQLKDHFIKRSFEQFGIIFNSKGGYEHKSFWDSRWGAHYLTAIEINKNNPILGSGLHSYRIECLDKKYEKINSNRYKERCNTHPHNIYLEIFSELGTLFFIFIIIFNIYFLFRLFKIYFFDKRYVQESSILISLYFMLFFPLQTTGSLFSTWNGVIYWITIALCLNLFKKSMKNSVIPNI
ncbi:O-antigen ligase family protein, partial [Candidatus Pelagibacter bacterium]|nr:O-antigen ligase family protein [Candidatus Pelagibacter bacterium]